MINTAKDNDIKKTKSNSKSMYILIQQTKFRRRVRMKKEVNRAKDGEL